MGRGRKRKFNPAIPSHVDQQALPQGLYWESNAGSCMSFIKKEGVSRSEQLRLPVHVSPSCMRLSKRPGR